MNPSRRTSLPFLPSAAALLVAAVLLGVFLFARGAREARPTAAAAVPGVDITGSTIGGAFVLTDQNGKTARDTDFAGRYRLVYFGYSFCPDICPTDVQRMTQALTSFDKAAPERAERVQPIFVSVDPERDTVPALKAFAANFHPRLVALTGSTAAIDAAKKAYKVYAAKASGSKGTDYLMDHSSFTYLMGPEGQPLAMLDSRAPASDLVAMLEANVR